MGLLFTVSVPLAGIRVLRPEYQDQEIIFRYVSVPLDGIRVLRLCLVLILRLHLYRVSVPLDGIRVLRRCQISPGLTRLSFQSR